MWQLWILGFRKKKPQRNLNKSLNIDWIGRSYTITRTKIFWAEKLLWKLHCLFLSVVIREVADTKMKSVTIRFLTAAGNRTGISMYLLLFIERLLVFHFLNNWERNTTFDPHRSKRMIKHRLHRDAMKTRKLAKIDQVYKKNMALAVNEYRKRLMAQLSVWAFILTQWLSPG